MYTKHNITIPPAAGQSEKIPSHTRDAIIRYLVGTVNHLQHPHLHRAIKTASRGLLDQAIEMGYDDYAVFSCFNYIELAVVGIIERLWFFRETGEEIIRSDIDNVLNCWMQLPTSTAAE